MHWRSGGPSNSYTDLSMFVAQQLFLCWIYSAEGFLVKLIAASCAMTTSTHLCNVYPFAFTDIFSPLTGHSPDEFSTIRGW